MVSIHPLFLSLSLSVFLFSLSGVVYHGHCGQRYAGPCLIQRPLTIVTLHSIEGTGRTKAHSSGLSRCRPFFGPYFELMVSSKSPASLQHAGGGGDPVSHRVALLLVTKDRTHQHIHSTPGSAFANPLDLVLVPGQMLLKRD